jgi:AraC family transcriptional regulator
MATRRTDTGRDYAQRIIRVLVFIQDNLDRSLPLEELAAVACFSPFHFHRVFRGMVGESVKQHVRRLRLARAAGRLKTGTRPVLAIALEAGYETHESFTRAFGRAFGCPPTEFRRGSHPQHLAAPADVHLRVDAAVDFHPVKFEEEKMKVEIKEMATMHVLFLRHVGPYDEVGETWERLCDWAGERGLIDGDSLFLGTSYDDPEVTPADKLRYDACITVPTRVVGEGEFGVTDLPAGRYATTIHEGPYSGLNETYSRIYGGWFAMQGLEPGPAPCVEFYLNSPEDTAPEDLLTEVYVPIAGVPA